VSEHRRLSRRLAVPIALVGTVAAHGLLPAAIGRRSGRSGGTAARVLGAGCLAAGSAILVWSLGQHYGAAPEGGYEIGTLAPDYLLRRGPYRFSRNPMYVSEVVIWSGWTLWFAAPVLAVLTAGFALFLHRAARLEEAALARRFGRCWLDYAARTPRWVGLPA
jgi:protein-S-isoprenylcysteine O-methyltransferase Ste14